MLDWLRRPRRRRRRHVVRAPGLRRAQRARRRQPLRHPAALRRGAAAARHRRRAQVRRAAARRALPDAQRRRADRPRPHRPARAARGARRARDARARRRSRTRPPTASCARSTDGAVTEFVEKPAPDQIDTHNISAGAYVLERSVLELLEPGEPASIERDVFPRLVGDGPLRLRRRGLLARHRDARALPAGHLRHPRGHGRAPAVAERMGDGFLCVEHDVENARADHPVGAGGERLPDRARARGSAAAPCSSAA